MRVSNNMLASNLIQSLQINQSELAKQQILISSGKKYIRRSDNAIDGAQAANVKGEQALDDRFEKNLLFANFWSKSTGGVLDQINEILHRLSEISVAATNGTHPETYRQDLATEVNHAIEDLLDLANTKIDNVYLFGGTISDQSPFTVNRDGDGNIISVTYTGSSQRRTIAISETSTMEYGLTGGGTDGVFQTSTTNLFQVLIDLRDQLKNGEIPSDTVKDQLDVSIQNVRNKLVLNGYDQDRLEKLFTRVQDRTLARKERLSQVENLDVAEAAVNLSQLQASYQATLQMAVRINNLSILNYL